MIYLLDTTTLSDLVKENKTVYKNLRRAMLVTPSIYISRPSYYEIVRGFISNQASTKLKHLHDTVIPRFDWIDLVHSDWFLAAQYWADARKQGRQLSDMDLLIAAIAKRLDAILVSSDADFDALPITREDWRKESI